MINSSVTELTKSSLHFIPSRKKHSHPGLHIKMPASTRHPLGRGEAGVLTRTLLGEAQGL
jgi:hypothetical protein